MKKNVLDEYKRIVSATGGDPNQFFAIIDGKVFFDCRKKNGRGPGWGFVPRWSVSSFGIAIDNLQYELDQLQRSES